MSARINAIGESLASIVLDLPPQPWSSAQILTILARAEEAGYRRGLRAPQLNPEAGRSRPIIPEGAVRCVDGILRFRDDPDALAIGFEEQG